MKTKSLKSAVIAFAFICISTLSKSQAACAFMVNNAITCPIEVRVEWWDNSSSMCHWDKQVIQPGQGGSFDCSLGCGLTVPKDVKVYLLNVNNVPIGTMICTCNPLSVSGTLSPSTCPGSHNYTMFFA